jgi:hypothetical protein
MLNLAIGDDVCTTCGATVGAGCPESTPYDREAFLARHPELITSALLERRIPTIDPAYVNTLLMARLRGDENSYGN